MITKEIAAKIWHCYSEIEQGEKMIKEMQDKITPEGDLELKDGWGYGSNCLQLHIPNGTHNSYHIKQVSAEVALIVIQQHIEKQKQELDRMKSVCKIQLA